MEIGDGAETPHLREKLDLDRYRATSTDSGNNASPQNQKVPARESKQRLFFPTVV
jgi:hypothetical protein